MTNYQEFIAQAMMHNANLKETVRRQASQMEILRNKNNELEMMVGYLKDRLIEYDPSMKSQLEFLSF